MLEGNGLFTGSDSETRQLPRVRLVSPRVHRQSAAKTLRNRVATSVELVSALLMS